MRAFGDTIPRWPALAGVAALIGGALIAAFSPLLAALPALTVDAHRPTPAVVLLGAVLGAGGIVVLVARLAGLTRPVTAAQLGLRAPHDLRRALLLTAGAGMALAALAAAWQALGDPHGTFSIPPELDTRTLTARVYDLPVREPVAFGPALLVSALARCVVPVLAAEILVRGFAFPALAQWRGPVASALIVSVLFGGLVPLTGVAALSMLLGVGLCALYLATGSLLPGVTLTSVVAGAGLGVACELPVAQVAALAAFCGASALALAAAPALPARGLSRRPLLRGSEA